jgi:hypothetical protein
MLALWLKQLKREQLHDQGWIAINRRHHDLAQAIRPFIQQHFPEEEQEAAFDGFTLALLTLGHFEDIEKMVRKLGND